MNRRKKAEFPLLAEFARAYLHEDVVPEYGNALEAAMAYIRELPASEQKQLAAEAALMRARHPKHDTQNLNREFREMGSAWTFASFDEAEQVLKTFERGH